MAEYWYPLASPTLGDEEIDAATEVLRSRNTTMGAKVEQFEEAFARRVGAQHAVMVNSGSSADLLIAFALDGIHGEVIVPVVTWPTHFWSWKMSNLHPVFVDVDDLNATAATIEAAITPQTVGISLVHLMGVPCDMEAIMALVSKHDLFLTEDCCEALGSTYQGKQVGSFGDAAAWSFFFSHHITTMEGGMVTTDHAELATKIRTLRSHGWARHLADPPPGLDPRYTFVDWGFNLRPTEVAAAIGLVQLGRLDSFNEARVGNFNDFAAHLEGHPLVSLPKVRLRAKPAWFGIPMFVANGGRDRLAKLLESAGVETRPILAGNLTRQPAVNEPGYFPGADRVHDQGLYIGLHATRSSEAWDVGEIIMGFS